MNVITRQKFWQPGKTRLGSSQFAACIGIHPYMSQYEAYLDAIGLIDAAVNAIDDGTAADFVVDKKTEQALKYAAKRVEGRARTGYGRNHELDAVEATEMHTGVLFRNTIRDGQESSFDGRYRSTPDGDTYDDKATLEVKCRTVENNWETIQDFHYHLPQVQAGIHMRGKAKVCYFTARGLTEEQTRIWCVPKATEYMSLVTELVDKFMDMLDNGDEPKKRFSGKSKLIDKLLGLHPECIRVI